jgi:hypothetical protein
VTGFGVDVVQHRATTESNEHQVGEGKEIGVAGHRAPALRGHHRLPRHTPKSADRVVDGDAEVVGTDRLGQVRRHITYSRVFQLVLAQFAGQHNEGRMIGAERLEQIEARSVRHQVVAHDHVKRLFGQRLDRLPQRFYSDDGQVVSFAATKSTVVRTETLGEQSWQQENIESYDVVMVLEDGNWRVNYMVRCSVESGPWILDEQEAD